ncbi:MGMT family protein [Flavobacteriales bacterium]|jgi:methylated-DNA-protein-cysteine methyltransferase related protein|nr:MGMT family protein [Flavobacteriales bacterium]MDB2362230.1 MGMT family protein [Flavobacteriales bacterium]
MSKKTFFQRVYEVTKQIPEGRVSSYGAIAKHISSPQASRMVGWALNKVNAFDVPAHRVVNRKGMLTGKYHFDGITLMQQLLENEGIRVVDNQVQDFEKVFWDPSKELI